MPVLFRLLGGPQPTGYDFRANLVRCRPRRMGELLDVALWAGVSMFDSPAPLERLARRHHMGTHLVQVGVPDDDPRVVLGPRSGSGHYTVWACEQVLLDFVRGETMPLAVQ